MTSNKVSWLTIGALSRFHNECNLNFVVTSPAFMNRNEKFLTKPWLISPSQVVNFIMSHYGFLFTIRPTKIDRVLDLKTQGPANTYNESEEQEEEEQQQEEDRVLANRLPSFRALPFK